MEVIYSSSNKDYDFRDNKTQQAGASAVGKSMCTELKYFHILLILTIPKSTVEWQTKTIVVILFMLGLNEVCFIMQQGNNKAIKYGEMGMKTFPLIWYLKFDWNLLLFLQGFSCTQHHVEVRFCPGLSEPSAPELIL